MPDTAERRPGQGGVPDDAPGDGIGASVADLDPRALLALSEERELQEALRHADYHRGYLEGGRSKFEEGYAAAVTDLKTAQHEHVASLAVYLRAWHVCCGPCRRAGHRDGCSRCEDRTRETFGRPHPDDHPGQEAAA
jgi:hypothetical protein